MEYQKRYIAYAKLHDKTPDEMMAHDEKRWPGGIMCGYICFIMDMTARYRRAAGLKDDSPIFDQNELTWFIESRVNQYPHEIEKVSA